MADKLVLVTGSGGKTGRAVTAALAERGFQLRLFRKSSHIQQAAASQYELFSGDLLDFQDLVHACQGVDAIYHIGPNMHPAEQHIGLHTIRAAQQTGIEHFVYHSVLHPQIEAMPHHWRKLRVEEALLASNLHITILQPAAYYQNIRHQWQDILASGEYRVPYRLETRISQVDLRQVAQVAAEVTLNPKHYHASYPLVGEQAANQVDIAEQMSLSSGRDIRAVQVDRETWSQEAIAGGMPADRVQDFIAMFTYYEDHDFLGNDRILQMLVEGEPRPLLDYFKRLVQQQEG